MPIRPYDILRVDTLAELATLDPASPDVFGVAGRQQQVYVLDELALYYPALDGSPGQYVDASPDTILPHGSDGSSAWLRIDSPSAASAIVNDSAAAPGETVAAALDALAAAPAAAFQQPTYIPSIADPTTDLTFSLIGKQRPFEILPEALVQHRDSFETNAGFYTEFNRAAGAVVTTIGGGRLTTSGTGAHDRWYVLDRPLEVPFFTSSVEVLTAGNGASFNVLQVGVMQDEDNYVMAVWSLGADAIRIESRVAGTLSTLGSVSVTEPAAGPYKLALVMTKASIADPVADAAKTTFHAYYNIGNGWVYATNATVSDPDYHDPAVLSLFKGAFGISSGGTGTWALGSFECGGYGQVGIHDNALIRRKNGSPYVLDNKLYFTATAGATSGGSHLGVFSLDLTNHKVTRTGSIFVKRGDLILNDLPASVVWDEEARVWRVCISTWGNGFGGDLEVLYKEHHGPLLFGVTVLEDPAVLALTRAVAGEHTYDVDIWWDAATSRWYVVYAATTDSTFVTDVEYLAIDYTTDNFATFTSVLADSANFPYEGPRLMQIGGVLYAFIGGLSDVRVYNAKTGAFIGTLTGPAAGGTIIPHPMIFPVLKNSRTEWWLLHFDATLTTGFGSRGTLLLYRAAETETGFAFPLYGTG